MALVATLLALTALGGLGYSQLSTTSQTFTRVADDQALTLTTQLAQATDGAGQSVVDVIPFSEKGLDGVVIFDHDGRVTAAGGSLAPDLREMASEARAVAQGGSTLQTFRVPTGDGQERSTRSLSPWAPPGTLQVTIVRQESGAIAAAYRMTWATESLRSSAWSTLLGLVGGAGFICFGLLLLLGRLVTRPVARLADEVRHLGEGNLDAPLSDQSSPELEQLAADISDMRDDLTEAMRESSTDPLTGVANHRAFHEQLDEAVSVALRQGGSVAMVAIDLDNLKTINDRCGHVGGDRVLRALAETIAAASREGDLCARVGGDEFAVLCRDATRDMAEVVARRVRDAVAELPVGELLGEADALPISVSCGTSDLPGDSRSKDELVHRADAALYEAKPSRAPRLPADAPPASQPRDALAATVKALAIAVDAKDSCTRSHCETVADWAVRIGRRLGFEAPRLEALRRAALLHDVGKIGTPDAILTKAGPLTEAEFETMKGHSALGYRIALGGGLPPEEALWILHHHEHLDGRGYPHGLRGEEIPLESRVLLAADAFEAITSQRPYSPARGEHEAMAELRRCAGTQFDPAVVEALAAELAADGGPLDLEAELRAASRERVS